MGLGSQFTIRTERRAGAADVALVGELDLLTVPILEEDLARFEREGIGKIKLDLNDLTFLDCSALRAFLCARDRANANGHRLLLVGASPCARRLFELTGTKFLLDEG
ncbi:MAG TPA: STAS domain-containing protein [Actinomycetota bacterium]|jgi:anti-sigma B factor antagonist|nr:STAS domain-containing protein [Actinomycetota bacterium]